MGSNTGAGGGVGQAPPSKRRPSKAAIWFLRAAGYVVVVFAYLALLPASFTWGGLLPAMLAAYFLVFGLAFLDPRDLLGLIASLAGTVAGGFFGHTASGPIVFFACLGITLLVVAWEAIELGSYILD